MKTGRDDLMTVRADKLFLSIAVRRELGVQETTYTDEQIRDLLRDIGVSIVVAQRDFWTDLDQMAALQRVLDGPDFEEIRRIRRRVGFDEILGAAVVRARITAAGFFGWNDSTAPRAIVAPRSTDHRAADARERAADADGSPASTFPAGSATEVFARRGNVGIAARDRAQSKSDQGGAPHSGQR